MGKYLKNGVLEHEGKVKLSFPEHFLLPNIHANAKLRLFHSITNCAVSSEHNTKILAVGSL